MSVYGVPEGFEPDPGRSGLYYRSDMVINPATGEKAQRVTWFNPQTGTYEENFYPAENVQPTPPHGAKHFVPAPLNNQKSVPPPLAGTGVIRLLSTFAWLIAVIGPIVVILRAIRGIFEVIPLIIQGVITDVTGDMSEGLEQLIDLEGAYARFQGIWEYYTDTAAGTGGGIISFVIGWLITAVVVLITYISMMVSLRTNAGAAKGLFITNLALCALGNWMCYSVVIRLYNVIGVIQPPYDNVPMLSLIFGFLTAALWLVAAIMYFIKTPKTNA